MDGSADWFAVARWRGSYRLILFDEFDPICDGSPPVVHGIRLCRYVVLAGGKQFPSRRPFGVGFWTAFSGSRAAICCWRLCCRVSRPPPRTWARYLAGAAALMGVGGVLAGGCTAGCRTIRRARCRLAAILAIVMRRHRGRVWAMHAHLRMRAAWNAI